MGLNGLRWLVRTGVPEQIETVYLIVRHLEANGRGIGFEGNRACLSGLKVFFRAGR